MLSSEEIHFSEHGFVISIVTGKQKTPAPV